MTLVDATVRISVILVAGFALAALCRARAAALRHWVLAAAMVCAALAPALAAIAPSWHVALGATRPAAAPSPAAPLVAASSPQTAVAVTTDLTVPAPLPAAHFSTASLLTSIWLAGAVVSLFVLVVGLARLMWIGSRARTVTDTTWNEMLRTVMREYRLTRSITLLETDRPLLVTWGAIAPKVLIPRAARSWSADRIRVVLRHELAHIRRADWVVQMFAEIVRAVYWFNPLLWIACRRVRDESEHACDDAVLGLGVEGSDYAAHLLDLARSMTIRRRAWVPAQAIVRPSSLERRISAMLNARLDRHPVSMTRRLAVSAAIFAITIVVAGFAASAQSTTILTGTISDQLGGVLPDAPIALTSLDNGAKHEVRSDRAGHYAFVGLPSGDYMLRINGIVGFKAVEQRLVLTGATMQRNLTLHIGAIQETITVTDAPPSGEPTPSRPSTTHKREGGAPPCSDDCVGGNIGAPIKLRDVKPIFPSSQFGVGGVVHLKGIIDTTGHVTGLQVVGDANADLAQAAITAVSQWEFDPTRLNGQVIETEMNVAINFAAKR
jgi:TonB family protein